MKENENIFSDKINRMIKNQHQALVFKCPYDEECSFQGPTDKALEHL